MDVCPSRFGHCFPNGKSFEAPFEQPFWLILFGRDEADDVFVEAQRCFIGLHVGNKSIFVIATGGVFDGVFALAHNLHCKAFSAATGTRSIRVIEIESFAIEATFEF